MFDSKKTKLFDVEKKETFEKSTVVKDPFLRGAIKTDTTLSGNLSEKLKTTGSDFLDQFASASKYRTPRTYEEISKDMQTLWSQNPFLTLKFMVYLRLITRVSVLPDSGTKMSVTQRGQGLIHESIMRMLWLIINHPVIFIENVYVFIAAGSWKDLIKMMQYDAIYNGYEHSFDWNYLIEIIKSGLKNPNTVDLVKKYLPTIRTKKNCKTIESQADNLVAKAICHSLFGNKDYDNPGHIYRKYRILKTSGTAHQWQQLISKREFKNIDFNTIAGRALTKLVNSKFLDNQGLTKKYEEWIESQPVAKFTGYVYELFAPFVGKVNVPNYKIKTVNSQFEELLNKAKVKIENNGLICVLDTSGSMSSEVPGTKTSAYIVAKTMTLFFSELLKGRFHDYYFEFSEKTILKKFSGETYYDKMFNDESRITANTNFISVATKFVEILQSGVKEEDFPSGILCISDGEFDRSNSYGWREDLMDRKTEVSKFRQILLDGGFSKEFSNDFKIILWDIPNNYYGKPKPKFESLGDETNAIHIGGLDGSIVSLLLGDERIQKVPSTTEELFEAAMDQEIFNYITI